MSTSSSPSPEASGSPHSALTFRELAVCCAVMSVVLLSFALLVWACTASRDGAPQETVLTIGLGSVFTMIAAAALSYWCAGKAAR